MLTPNWYSEIAEKHGSRKWKLLILGVLAFAIPVAATLAFQKFFSNPMPFARELTFAGFVLLNWGLAFFFLVQWFHPRNGKFKQLAKDAPASRSIARDVNRWSSALLLSILFSSPIIYFFIIFGTDL